MEIYTPILPCKDVNNWKFSEVTNKNRKIKSNREQLVCIIQTRRSYRIAKSIAKNLGCSIELSITIFIKYKHTFPGSFIVFLIPTSEMKVSPPHCRTGKVFTHDLPRGM